MTARPSRATSLLALVLLGLAGCLNSEFVDPDTGTTAPVDVVDAGEEVASPDAADDAGADTGVADAGFDTGAVADGGPDVADGSDTAGDADTGASSDAAGQGLPLGHTCVVDDDCASSLCLATTAAAKTCSEACTGDCPAGLRCGVAPASGNLDQHFCLPLPGSLCRACESDADCTGGACLPLGADKQQVCGVSCGEDTDGSCPAGFVCQSFMDKGLQCVPVLDTCACTAALDGSKWPCAVTTPLGQCAGNQLCGASGWQLCDASVPTGELCDGLDNDCNGQTDEVYGQLGAPCGQGVCAGGKKVCGPSKKDYACSTDAKKLKKELCGNGLDDDCNGKADDGCPPKDADGDGTPDAGDCAPYNSAVHPGAKEGCCPAALGNEPVSEATKGCDANCDGLVSACAAGDFDGDGFSGDDCGPADPKVNPKAPDKCGDGIDQDCDGADAVCDKTLDSDGDGYMLPDDCDDDDKSRYPGAPEKCNNLDDNCNKVVDEGNPGGGAQCGVTQGACKPGTLVCIHIGLSAQVSCTDAQGGEPEVCNGKDDDCNGQTDENFPDLGKTCDSDDADLCSNGSLVCSADGQSLVCGLEQVHDVLELCKSPGVGNGKDEDCNGQIDEVCYTDDYDGDGAVGEADCNPFDAGYGPDIKGEPCCPAGMGATAQGQKLCDKNCDGQVTACKADDKDYDGFSAADGDCNDADPQVYPGSKFDKCGDGIDQDCDGVDPPGNPDDGCVELADTDADGFADAVDCKPTVKDIYPGAPELCNGKDDDCDGAIDDGNPGAKPGACGAAVGECKAGQEACVRIGLKGVVQCVPSKGPSIELCNGKDDNCNGKTDEYFPDLGKPCDGDDSDVCKNGFSACSTDGKSTVCASEAVENLAELCNGQDDDCNGKTDENLLYFGKSLGATCKGLGACGQGTVVCSAMLEVAVCSTDAFGTTPQSQPEVCDGLDNDCDGLTDEGMLFGSLPLGAKCFGAGACGKVQGVVQCSKDGGATAICSTMAGGTNFQGKLEVCNGVDDNCDGHIDENLGVADSTCKQVGVCATGTVAASCKFGQWACNYSNVNGYQGDKEVLCDGVDNNCDGQTDEAFGVGQACDGDDGDQCKNGVIVCTADKLGGVCGDETVKDVVEVCNGEDDDCDGKTDEEFGVGEPCDSDDSDQCKNGTWTCNSAGDGVVCSNESKVNLAETCNGLDDDCNGKVDESWPELGMACDGTDTDACKNGVTVCSANGSTTTCGVESVSGIIEICNGDDDDCDGQTDEGQNYEDPKLNKPLPLGADCNGKGLCAKGKVVCSPINFAATCSTNPDAFLIFDGQELCDGLDNDCNGQIDDNLSWKGIAKGQPCDPGGICGTGVVECAADKQVTCSTLASGSNPKAKLETCNGKDDDCNGKTDEELTVKDSTCLKVGVCASPKVNATCALGQWSCDYSSVAGYQETEDKCDGLDNDCDGQTDEGFNVGQACDGADTDQCKTGTFSCAADGKTAECVNESATNIPEVCDGQDNDCNGKVDEGFTYQGAALGAACKGQGECGGGVVVCGLDQLATCSSNPDAKGSQAKPEACDGLDNDCDGKVDNGLKFGGLPVGAPCSGVGECGNGQVVCFGGKPVCSVNPDGPNSAAKAELCNSKDDDCNGQTDEALDPKKSSCNQQGVCAQALTAVCQVGKWSCSYTGFDYETKELTCDDKDNDCNGVTDDPFPSKGKPCDGPDPDSCKSGSFVCETGGKSVVCFEPQSTGGPTAEICDGKDNDCNGQTDENFPELGQPCDGADADKCTNGTWSCTKNGLSVECVNEFPASVVEQCNGKDDDCNGQIDDGLGLGQACDGPDSDKCKFGVLICGDNGKTTCGAETQQNIPEKCNGKDDDCDGVIDNSFEAKGLKCDTANDNDSCETGTYQCAANGTLACVGDVGCVSGAKCSLSGSQTVPDACLCGSALCSSTQGDKCTVDQKCLCGVGSPCPTGKACSAGVCK